MDREWVILGCDGPPLRMASIITQKEPQKCDWVYLVPGLAHLHMNPLKTILQIMDKIMLEPLGKKVLKFKSPKAYQFLVNAKDTHKTYQTFQILLFRTAAEFCKKYIQSCIQKQINVTPQRFLDFISDIENETFGLVGELVFNFYL